MEIVDWAVVFWTALSWMFSGAVLYLVYDLGQKSAREQGLKSKSWATVVLLLTFTIAVMFFVFGSVPHSLREGFNEDELSILTGIMIVISLTYTAAFFEAKRHPRAL
jgi:drug/metabolite transporter (DMT)-like permease